MSMEMTAVADALKEARELMNDSGAHWTQGQWARQTDNGDTAYCAVGALRSVTGYVSGDDYGPVLWEAIQILSENEEVKEAAREQFEEEFEMLPPVDRVIAWNDDGSRTWEEISEIFTRTEERVRAEAQKEES